MTKRLLISMLTLLCCTGMWATGELNGLFTINASGGKVQFSQGNLQYFCSTTAPEWRFAEHQYDYVAFDGSAYAENSEKWIDLFGYGTSGYNNGQTCYQPYSTSESSGNYYGSNLTGNADWGYNAISNGGNTENSGWRTLTKAEWEYLFSSRTNASSKYGQASINGVNGMILLPDEWTLPAGLTFTSGNHSWATNTYTIDQWTQMENAGAVFLPASGSRAGTSIPTAANANGLYRSSTAAYYLCFKNEFLEKCTVSYFQYGDAVRLVKDYQLQQDTSGNYLLGSAYDWKLFADIVKTTPDANAKMTADIDLGDDQTHIGDDVSYAYRGVFDGQGHKLNVNYYCSSSSTSVEGGYSIAPFRNIKGATIKNLAVTGNITGYMHCAGVAGYAVSPGTNLINNVIVSANITIINSHGGGFIGHNGNATTTTIQDCLFNGTINGNTVGVFFGWSESTSMSLINCLENGSYTNCSTFTPTSCPGYAVPTVTNCYYAASGSYPGTQATATTLSDGTVTEGLNAGRTGDDAVWVQDLVTNQPMLKLFAFNTDASGYYLIGSVQDWKDFAAIVNNGTNPAVNAKMTADIDLGTDVTMVGSTDGHPYQGVFDGQGHTLTVNWSVNGGGDGVAPFRYIDGATIKKLHVDGSISATGSTQRVATSIVAYSIGNATSTISECWSSASVTSYDTMGGIFGVAYNGASTVNITDCLFTGSVNPTHVGEGCSAGFASQASKEGSNIPTINITRGLYMGTSTGSTVRCYNFVRNDYPDLFGTHTVTDCYYKDVYGTAQGTQATTEQLADGTTTTALNAGRTVWVQQGSQPMLKLFAVVTLTDGGDLTALSAYAGQTCRVAYSRSFTAGKSSTVCLPFDYTKQGTEGSFYEFTSITKEGDEYVATMTEPGVSTLTANTPYLFTPSATGSVDFSGTYEIPASITAGETVSGDWTFLGTYETISWTTAPTGIYGFSAQAVAEDDISVGEFVKVGEYVRIKPMRCYLKYKNGLEDYAEARARVRAENADESLPETIKVRLINANGEVTAIGSLSTVTGEVTLDSDVWYTLNGIRIEGMPTVPGIYVNNGKKVIIK